MQVRCVRLHGEVSVPVLAADDSHGSALRAPTMLCPTHIAADHAHALPTSFLGPQIQAAEEARTQAEQAQSAAETESGTLRRQLAAAEGRLSLVDGLEAEAAEAKHRAAAAEQQAAELEEQLGAAKAEAQAQQRAADALRGQLEEVQAAVAAAKAAAEEAEARRWGLQGLAGGCPAARLGWCFALQPSCCADVVIALWVSDRTCHERSTNASSPCVLVPQTAHVQPGAAGQRRGAPGGPYAASTGRRAASRCSPEAGGGGGPACSCR